MHPAPEGTKACWLLAGGRSRLGRALAESLAPGRRLALSSSRSWAGEEAWLEGLGARGLVWDAEDPELAARMAADLAALGVRFKGALLVAGSFEAQPFGSWTAESLARTWRVNLGFPFLAAQALEPWLEDGACLQLILDAAVHRPFLKRLPYSAAKAGQAALVEGLARLLGPRVRVVGHALGTALAGDHDDVDALKAANLLGRIGSPEDLARAIEYAAASPYLTGEILTLDGGWHIK